MAATAVATRPAQLGDGSLEIEISQPVPCVAGFLGDQLPPESEVRVLAVTGSSFGSRTAAISAFLSEACGAPTHLEVLETTPSQVAVLKAEEGAPHLAMLLADCDRPQPLPEDVAALVVHLVQHDTGADWEALVPAMPNQINKVSLCLLFPEDFTPLARSEIAVAALALGFQTVCALTMGSTFTRDLAEQVVLAPSVPWNEFVQSYNASLQEPDAGADKLLSMQANAQAAEAVADSADLYARRLDACVSNLPLPMQDLAEHSNHALRESLARIQSRLGTLSCLSETECTAHLQEFLRRISRDRAGLCKLNMSKSESQCLLVAEDCWKRAFVGYSDEQLHSTVDSDSGGRVALVAQLVQQFAERYEKDPRAVGPAKSNALDHFVRQKAPLIEELARLSHEDDLAQQEEMRVARAIAEAFRAEDMANMLTSLRLLEQVQAEELLHAQELATVYLTRGNEALAEQLQVFSDVGQRAQLTQQQAAQAAAEKNVDATSQAFQDLRRAGKDCSNELEKEAKEMESMSKGLEELDAKIKDLNKPAWWEVALQWVAVAGSAIAGVALCIVGGPAGALVGGMLLSAGLSTGMKMAFNGGSLEWKEFGKSVGVGLATGLVSGGIGLGIGAAMSSATTAIGVTSTAAKAAVVVSHAGAYAVGGTVSSMAGCVIDNLASQRKWDEGLGQAAAAGAATGFISGAIAGVGACKEALGSVEKARQAANTTADQIGERAASVQPSSLKALQDAGRAFGESTLTGTVDGLLSAAFDDNVKLGDAVVMGLIGGCVSGAAGAAIAAGRVKWEAHRQSKVVDQLKELEHDHSYLHHSATITEEEQIARITTGLQGSATTETSGVFHDADALKKVTQQSSEAVQKKGLQLCKDVSASKEQLANLTAELKNLQATTDQIQAQLKGNLPKEQRQALGKRLSELKTQRAALYPQIETAQAGANLGIVKDRVVIGQPKGGGSWGTSLKNDNGVIKELPNCQAAAINAKYELHEVAGKVEVKSTKIVSVFPVAAPGQEHMARGLKLKPLSTAKYQVAVRQAARDIIQVQAGNMPAGWETAVTSDGERYYFNRKLGLTQWDHPYL